MDNVADNIDILLVEDNPNDEMLVMHAFKRHNIAIHGVRDGLEALDFIFCTGFYAGRSTGNPKVIFLDVKMPLMDGFEVLLAIRSDPRTRLVPVVMLTSSGEERDIIESYRLGVNSYIVKPVEFEKLIEVVRHVGHYWPRLNHDARSVSPTACQELSVARVVRLRDQKNLTMMRQAVGARSRFNAGAGHTSDSANGNGHMAATALRLTMRLTPSVPPFTPLGLLGGRCHWSGLMAAGPADD
jgi:two-component system response regulator